MKEERKGRGKVNLAHDDPGYGARTHAKADHVEDDGQHTQVPVPLEHEGRAKQAQGHEADDVAPQDQALPARLVDEVGGEESHGHVHGRD